MMSGTTLGLYVTGRGLMYFNLQRRYCVVLYMMSMCQCTQHQVICDITDLEKALEKLESALYIMLSATLGSYTIGRGLMYLNL